MGQERINMVRDVSAPPWSREQFTTENTILKTESGNKSTHSIDIEIMFIRFDFLDSTPQVLKPPPAETSASSIPNKCLFISAMRNRHFDKFLLKLRESASPNEGSQVVGIISPIECF